MTFAKCILSLLTIQKMLVLIFIVWKIYYAEIYLQACEIWYF